MRILYIILLVFMYSCTLSIGQQQDEQAKKEMEYQELLKKAKESQAKSEVAIRMADEQTTKTIQKAANTITTLKEEVKELKQELNETNKKLDSVSDNTNPIKFELRPIPDGKENR